MSNARLTTMDKLVILKTRCKFLSSAFQQSTSLKKPRAISEDK